MPVGHGTLVAHYRVEENIGEGGMGRVYRAVDTRLNRDVALKVLAPSFATDQSRLDRIRQEGMLLAALNHPNIAHLYAIEPVGDSIALIMELVEGPTLADRLALGPIPPDEALHIAIQVAEALESAHARQIVHRDLKPANVKLRPDGHVKVLDFGLAKGVEVHGASGGQGRPLTTPAVTETGMILGTAAYMSPEQARGQPIDQRADIWAFGCLLFEMLTGERAFGDEDVMLTLAHVLDRDTNMDSIPRAVSPAVRQTIRLCLQKDPRKRIADIRDVRLALRGDFESGQPSPVAPAPLSWHRLLPYAAALLVGAAATFALVSLRTPRLPPQAVSRFLVTPPPGTRLGSQGGTDIAISPDGRRLAFFAEDGAGTEVTLYIRHLDSLEVRPVRGSTVAMARGPGDMNPFFSHDGTWVGFRVPGEGIMRVPIDGGPPIKMADDTGLFLGGAASSDGMLIYSSGNALYRAPASGGGPSERLTPDTGPGTLYISPVLLPSERALLVNHTNDRVAVFDLETRQERILIEEGQNPRYIDTGHLVFARGTTLMAVPFDLERHAITGAPVALFQGVRRPGANSAADFALAPNGTLAYIPPTATEVDTSGVVWVGKDGGVLEPALRERLSNPRDLHLSPDGTRVLVTTGNFGTGELWVHDTRGRPPVVLANRGDNIAGAWSPDGRQVAFFSNSLGAYDVLVVSGDGGSDPAPLWPDPVGAAPAAWPIENELILTRPSPSFDLLAARTSSAELRELVATSDDEFDATLSPNGRWLAYASTRTGQAELWVKPYPDGSSIRLSASGGSEPVWARDGLELYFRQGRAIMSVAVDAEAGFTFGPPRELFQGPYTRLPQTIGRTYDVAADGRFLMIVPPNGGVEEARASSIIVVENWSEEVARQTRSQ